MLQRGGGEDEACLEEVAQDQPAAAARADPVAELACKHGGEQEKAERDADVRRLEDGPVGFGQDDGQDEEDGIAGLVGGEAVEIGEGNGIFGAGY